jgi:hypothetical protein
MRIVYTISPCLLYVYVSKLLALFHHTRYVYVSMFSLYFTIFIICLCIQVTYTISPYYFVYLCIHAFTLFHHIFGMFMYPSYLHYFTIQICLCIQAFGSISPYRLYVYVSTFMYYFTVHINRARYVSILICYFTIQISMFMYPCVHSISPYYYVYVSKVLTLFHHTYVFMYPCFCSISPYILIIYVMYPNYSHYFTT